MVWTFSVYQLHSL